MSSDLFEAPFGGQRRYTERLYLMRGLTTKFKRPKTPPQDTLSDLRLLGLPPLVPFRANLESSMLVEGLDTAQEQDGGKRLYLVPQTLYKLHPDFDRLLRGILEADPNGVVAMPAAQEDGWTDAASSRLASSLGPDLRARLVFFRRLSFAEFSALVQRAHVVLDPFPVGGGRSTFEVLAGHTPVVMLYPRTSVLQLTHGMYVTMGIVPPVNASGIRGHVSRFPESLVTHTVEEFVAAAVAVATNATLRCALHEMLAASSHKIYGREDVVDEWAEFLTFASEAPRPASVAWWRAPHGFDVPDALRARELFGDKPQSWPAVDDVLTAVERAERANAAWSKAPKILSAESTIEPDQGSSTTIPTASETIPVDRQLAIHLQLASKHQPEEWWYSRSSPFTDGAGLIEINAERHKKPSSVVAMAASGGAWHWIPRPWGWEAVDGPWKLGMLAPNERARGLQYALKMSHENDRTGEDTSLLVEVRCFFVRQFRFESWWVTGYFFSLVSFLGVGRWFDC